MKGLKKGMSRKAAACAAAILCGSLIFTGCISTQEKEEKIQLSEQERILAGQEQTEEQKQVEGQMQTDETERAAEAPAADQVLEVGILADGNNYYAVVAFEVFCREAGKSSVPVTAEYHDSRDGYEAQKSQLERLVERGTDLLLVDVGKTDQEQELAEEIRKTGLPVLFFGTIPKPETLELTGGEYVGLSQEEERELSKALKDGQFEESGFRERGEEAGKELLDRAIEKYAE